MDAVVCLRQLIKLHEQVHLQRHESFMHKGALFGVLVNASGLTEVYNIFEVT